MWIHNHIVFSGKKREVFIGYDLWCWSFPLCVDVDFGLVSIMVLCFYLRIGW